jgi:transitional endoplasmic reticulum ATPase
MRFSLPVSGLCSGILLHLASASQSHENNPSGWAIADQYFQHNAGQRVNTDTVIYRLLTEQYRDSDITIVPRQNCDLFAYAAAGLASTTAWTRDASLDWYEWRLYQSPLRRFDGDNGTLTNDVKFGIYNYAWKGSEFTVFLVDGRDGPEAYTASTNQYLIGPRSIADKLVLAAGYYGASLHNEMWVFDYGYWQKDASLWATMNKSSWDNVILDEDMKSDLISNVLRFFDSQDQYTRLRVPWKRGIIFHGPPGNGKTISIKATMHSLYDRSPPIPSLYVKSLSGYGEYALSAIFEKARSEAPCYLVFEDLDSLVTSDLRSYFLNEIDGLQENDGILIVGSTNHLERLDPGIAKRPSRFDRKFFFPDPSFAQRVQYCEFWRMKLAENDEIEFPVALVKAIANITDGFSFAYIQEAFVASLLLIAGDNDAAEMGSSEGNVASHLQLAMESKDGLDDLRLWRVIREQVRILRNELEAESLTVQSSDEDSYEQWGHRYRSNQVFAPVSSMRAMGLRNRPLRQR